MSEQLLLVLKLCLLAFLYLFFFRVLRAVWAEVRAPSPVGAPARAGGAPVASAPPQAVRRDRRVRRQRPPHLVVVEPPEQRGVSFPLGNEVTIGRAAGCQVTLDDTYVSQLHARVFVRDGAYLIEDLGSTNGTYLNRQRVSGPMVVRKGDRIQVGNTVLELR
ncbi:MAG: FHA domain-containing protein [Acidimicrobiales bacterium]